ncbi:H/ACA ribonucleoprotein complex non-core subunit NAF1 [Lingula anatina]|uniref:H/ACA ribonucleoprotein complex non-core subunit NAF1 n=1 Tax=Lingula anatina TaxID=7574 RepID=A0A1S3KCX7_LINAN|nr:H/ACA ribonucleoprotein complex non-core subunit NAF1 [Lingula anatina]|eukprot:XP_013420485.1 H/ACA ribonucleoprotein complex non-core subunit NAF1 [Lingula anatina]
MDFKTPLTVPLDKIDVCPMEKAGECLIQPNNKHISAMQETRIVEEHLEVKTTHAVPAVATKIVSNESDAVMEEDNNQALIKQENIIEEDQNIGFDLTKVKTEKEDGYEENTGEHKPVENTDSKTTGANSFPDVSCLSSLPLTDIKQENDITKPEGHGYGLQEAVTTSTHHISSVTMDGLGKVTEDTVAAQPMSASCNDNVTVAGNSRNIVGTERTENSNKVIMIAQEDIKKENGEESVHFKLEPYQESFSQSSGHISSMTFERLVQTSGDAVSTKFTSDSNESAAAEDISGNISDTVGTENRTDVFLNTQAEIKVEDGEEIVHFKVEPSKANAVYRQEDTEDSSCDSSDSTDSDDSSTDSSDDETSDMEIPEKTSTSKPIPVKTKGEFTLEDLPPIEELEIDVDDTVVMREIGKVSQILGTLVVIQQYPNLPALNEETVLFMEGRVVLGQIFEVFGPVPQPCYSVRFNSAEDIESKGVTVGQVITCAPEVEDLTHYVFVEQLKRMKGSDASWEHNNEPPPRFLDYSDDEEEQRMKTRMRGRGGEPGSEGGDEASDTAANTPKRKKNRTKKHPGSGDWEPGASQGPAPPPQQRWPPNPWNQGPPMRGPAWSPWGPPRHMHPRFSGPHLGMPPRPRSWGPRPRYPLHGQWPSQGQGQNLGERFPKAPVYTRNPHPMQTDPQGAMLGFPPPVGPLPQFVPQPPQYMPPPPQSSAPQMPPMTSVPMMDSRFVQNDQGLASVSGSAPAPPPPVVTQFGGVPSFQPGPAYR